MEVEEKCPSAWLVQLKPSLQVKATGDWSSSQVVLTGTMKEATGCVGTLLETDENTTVVVAKQAAVAEPPYEREMWGKKIEFLLAVIGYAVDLGNVWRFPYVCYRNGGGAFLIPYFIMLIFGGLPLFYLELALGQYHRTGIFTVWAKVCPMFKGIAFGVLFIASYTAMHYNTIIGYAVYYMVLSFRSDVLWRDCGNEWNTPCCVSDKFPMNSSSFNFSVECNNRTTSAAEEFFERYILERHRSDGLNYVGPVKWQIAVCVMSIFVLVYFSLWKGIKSSGKAVWITATLPYVVLIILLIRGVTLPGSKEGIIFYLKPEWKSLTKPRVWIDAAIQNFFSLGPGFGTLLALSSYNKFHNNCYKDALLTSSINCLTSILAGFVVFSVLGHMAFIQGTTVDKVAAEGPGLVYVAYPEAITLMKGSVFWAILFFLMLITLGIDSTFGGLEAIITGLCDEFPRLVGKRRELFVFLILVYCFIGSLPTTTYGGTYIIYMLNECGISPAILLIVFLEAIGVSWFYGVRRFANDIKEMIGSSPGWFWIICWAGISPILILSCFIAALLNYQRLALPDYEYPDWGVAIGWLMTFSSIICVPIYIVYKLLITPGTFMERLLKISRPEEVEVEIGAKELIFRPALNTDQCDTVSLTPVYV